MDSNLSRERRVMWPKLEFEGGTPLLDALYAECGDTDHTARWMEARLLGEDPNVDEARGEPPNQLFVWLRRRNPKFGKLLDKAWEILFTEQLKSIRFERSMQLLEELLRLADRWEQFSSVKYGMAVLKGLDRLSGSHISSDRMERLKGMAILSLRHVHDEETSDAHLYVKKAESYLQDVRHYSTALRTLLCLARDNLYDRSDHTIENWAVLYAEAATSVDHGPSSWKARIATAHKDAEFIIFYLQKSDNEKDRWLDLLFERSDIWQNMGEPIAVASGM